MSGEAVDLTIEEKIEQDLIDLTDQNDFVVQTPEPDDGEGPIPGSYTALPSYAIRGKTYKPGDDVELDNGEFFRIKQIVRCKQSQEVQLKGYRLARTNQICRVTTRAQGSGEMVNYFPKKHQEFRLYNELCLIAPTLRKVAQPGLEQCLMTISAKNVICRREIRFTNAQFPTFSHFEEPQRPGLTNGDAKNECPLVVRWKHAIARNKSGKSDIEGAIIRLTEDECDNQYRVPDVRLHQKFQQMQMQTQTQPSSVVDLTKDSTLAEPLNNSKKSQLINQIFTVRKAAQPQRSLDKTKTFGDICAGGGGSLCGATRASLKPLFAVDKCPIACRTLHMNNDKYKTTILNESIDDFLLTEARGFEHVDILHISFPCPTWSPAKTIPAATDDDNSACLFATTDLLLKCRPRVATFEQTFGLVTHYPGFFQSFISNVVAADYSVRWKIIDNAGFGLPSHRHRLEVIAACPGEPLPTFPEPTHGLGPGKLPYVTVGDILRKSDAAQAPDGMDMRGLGRPRFDPPYNAFKKMLRTCTCSGIKESHPSGKRPFNLFESQLLASFPEHHRFAGTDTHVKRQIGNAEPPVFAEVLNKHILKSMREFDRKVAAYKPPVIDMTIDD